MHLRTKLIIFNVIVCMYYEASSQNIDTLPALIGPEPKFIYEDCGCGYKPELRIFYGLEGNYGGQEVTGSAKTRKGAVTVANLNNTDGDMDIDNVDNDVSVNINGNGRDEVDLMKLIIDVSGTLPGLCKDVVTLTYGGNIKFWEKKTKGTEITNLSFLVSTLPRTIWVEAFAISTSYKDIEIILWDKNNKELDKVKATAIWCEKKMAYISRTSIPIPRLIGIDQIGLEGVINKIIPPDGSRYGYGNFFNPVANNINPNFWL